MVRAHPPVARTAQLVRAVTDRELQRLAGPGGFTRGQMYARQHRVSGLRLLADDHLGAHVRGSGTTRYHVDVALGEGGHVVAAECTCPLGGNCKHTVATVLVARQTLGLAGAVTSLTEPKAALWEQLLSDVLHDDAPTVSPTPLALLVCPMPDSAQGWGASTESRVALRPLIAGQAGWIKTGISWNTVSQQLLTPVVEPNQWAALAQIATTATRNNAYYGAEWLPLDALGVGWAALLRQASDTGVQLLTDQRAGGAVVVTRQPAHVRLDLTRDGPAGIVLTPTVTLPDELEGIQELKNASWVGLGTPPVGFWQLLNGDLHLTPLATPLTPAVARLLHHGPFRVPEPDVPRLLSVTVPRLMKRMEVGSSDDSVTVEPLQPPRLRLQLTHLPEIRLRLEWHFVYAAGEVEVCIPLGERTHDDVRDPAAERSLVAGVSTILRPRQELMGHSATRTAPAPIAELSGFSVVTFLRDVLPNLQLLDGVDVTVTASDVAYVESQEAPVIRLSLVDADQCERPEIRRQAGASADSSTDWFDLGIAISVAEQEVPLPDLIRAFTLEQEHVILPSGTWFRLDRPELADLRRLLEEARSLHDGPDGALRLSPYQVDLWAELESLGVIETQSERWASLVKGLTASTAGPVAAPAGLLATLRPYQLEGFAWLTHLRRHGLGGILADDMGLGKTLQTLAMIVQERADRASSGEPERNPAPWLVVAPTSVLSAWATESARFAPSLQVAVLPETIARRKTPLAEAIQDADLVITSYAVFRLDAEEFNTVEWAGLVLDEAQTVKNHQSVTYTCVRTLPVPVRFAITGTPMENNLMELWSLLSIVAPGLFPHPRRFAEHYRRPIESGTHPQRLDTLRRRIRPVLLRRTKQLVATELPPKQEQLVSVVLPPKHRRQYDRLLARQRQRVLGLLEDPNRNRIAILQALTVLRQASLHPSLVDQDYSDTACAKLDTMMELLEPVLAEGHQALVFSQFTRFLAMARARLDEAGIGYSYLDGHTRDRAQAIADFRSGGAPVFLISLKAGGVGLTLTEADYVIMLDPWWNPATEAQAIDRAHRIGQDKKVNVYRLVSAETIEDKVVALQERKRELFASVVDEGTLASGALSADDIRALL